MVFTVPLFWPLYWETLLKPKLFYQNYLHPGFSVVSHSLFTLVSSVLNKDIKQFGKQNLFDDCDETCWNSDQGKPQWVKIKLTEEFEIMYFSIQFQGGFAAKHLVFKSELNGHYEEISFFPDDNNSVQKFVLDKPIRLKSMTFIFNSSTDLFGRIVIYQLHWS